jgi:hypothetical protein
LRLIKAAREGRANESSSKNSFKKLQPETNRERLVSAANENRESARAASKRI